MLAKLATPIFVKIAAGVGFAMLLTIGLLTWQVSSLRSTVSAKDREIGSLNQSILFQNAQIQTWQAHGLAAQARADAAVAEALRVNAQQQPVIVSLRESAARPRGPSERCEISETLRNAEGL